MVQVKFVGGKMGRGEKVFPFTFHWPPSLEHSIGHQALDLPSLPFTFFLKGGLRSLGTLSFPRT